MFCLSFAVMSLDLDSQHAKAACGSADDKLVQFSVNVKSVRENASRIGEIVERMH